MSLRKSLTVEARLLAFPRWLLPHWISNVCRRCGELRPRPSLVNTVVDVKLRIGESSVPRNKVEKYVYDHECDVKHYHPGLIR